MRAILINIPDPKLDSWNFLTTTAQLCTMDRTFLVKTEIQL